MSELVKTEEVTGVAVSRPMGQVFDLTGSIVDLPMLADATEMPLDLMSDYWTPETPGEFKYVFFDRIDVTPALVKDKDGLDVLIDLECAYFLEQDAKKEIKSIRNGSKRLVGALLAQNVPRGTALKISFLGKKQNRNNAFKSDNWSIKPLLVHI